ncbi:YtxH domain-containing protein [Halobacillus litoralis]|uniref:YtxH domain-containing protein n=1 Tax=Halobacillus litoralis TaxID=45668 RepID=A0A845E570_9BACI|nr:YtxH domain-containing protein [Halobacillus litoralis]MYL50927.1 YtxH domain-containing protein [Halobacillus litoralis]
MGQSKLWKGVLLGALVGGVAALLDKETRQYVGEKSRTTGAKCQSYMKHPSEAIHKVRVNYESFSAQVNKGVEDLLELLDKAESMLNKVGEINQEVKEQLRAVDDSKEAS